jgi:nucleotide-binding universal stress UspA family protein
MINYTFDASCIWTYTHSVTAVSPRRIAVVLDGTRSAERALPCAADLAHTYRAELHVIYTFKAGNLNRASDLMIVAHTKPFEKARQEASLYVKTHCNKLRAQKIDVRGHTIEGASLAPLCGYLTGQNIDLVVMTRSAHTWIDRLFLGDWSAAIRRRTGIIVLNVDL